MMFLAATVLAVFAVAGHTDTTIAVRTGTRLEVSNFNGEISVSAWDRNAVRVEADHGPRTRIALESSASGLRISASGYRGVPGSVEYHISAPAWMPLDISAPFSDVSVDGARGEVKVETVKGDVRVRGGVGFVELSSVQGEVSLVGAKGRLKLSSINEGVMAKQVAGQLTVETVNGDIAIDDVQLDLLEASSVSGSLWFSGALLKNARYQLQSHNGNIQVVVPDHPSANVSVSTFSGDFSSDFDVMLNGTKRGNRRMSFLLGDGGPQFDLESFNGSIELLKASKVEAVRKKMKSHDAENGKAPKDEAKNSED
ncbi:MAG: DUF4097 family beta strand repeat protein [Candidatus Eisenbacteria bacterium]|nr:DUF4097 family beta strand repeat protein [Candidatus Eisenbacteria bacterium]